MCGLGNFFSGGGAARAAQQQQQVATVAAIQAQQQQQQQAQQAQIARDQAAASIASANLDTESSRVAAEDRMRRAAMASGFSSSLLGGMMPNRNGAGVKMLFGA